MKFSIRQMAISALTVVLLLAFSAPLVSAKKNRQQDATRHSTDAAKVFTEIMNVRERAIPKELLDKAEAIAVFPGVIKAAFIFGGKGGQGVISRRTRKGWTAPAFFNLSGGSFGALNLADPLRVTVNFKYGPGAAHICHTVRAMVFTAGILRIQ